MMSIVRVKMGVGGSVRGVAAMVVVLVVGWSWGGGAWGAEARNESRFSVTIYSMADPGAYDPQRVDPDQGGWGYRRYVPGFGVVREIRKIPLAKGSNVLKFTDVAAAIDATTVSFKSLTAPGTTAVLEQNFEYDLMSPQKLLEKYVGRNIIINRKQPLGEGEKVARPETIEARLLSFTEQEMVLQTNNKQLPVQIIPRNSDITEIKLFDLATGLITRPTLVWKVEAEQAGDHDVLVSYQTDQITWRADYGVVVSKDEKSADLSAWVTVVNESGAGYPEAKLKLVAGDVQRLRPEPRGGLFGGGGGRGGGGEDTGFKERAFFEYHLYSLGRPTTIANNSTKQIELFPPRAKLPVEKIFVYRGYGETGEFPTRPYTEQGPPEGSGNKKVDVFLKLNNSQKNGLGIPLPAGRVRVYKRDEADADDPAGMLEFIGEDKIDHTAREEDVLVRVGTAFDLVAERNAMNFSIDHERRTMTESFEVKLRNRKKEAVRVLAREKLYRWVNWEITASSDKYDKRDARTIQFPVEIGPDQEKKVTYTVKYTW